LKGHGIGGEKKTCRRAGRSRQKKVHTPSLIGIPREGNLVDATPDQKKRETGPLTPEDCGGERPLGKGVSLLRGQTQERRGVRGDFGARPQEYLQVVYMRLYGTPPREKDFTTTHPSGVEHKKRTYNGTFFGLEGRGEPSSPPPREEDNNNTKEGREDRVASFD